MQMAGVFWFMSDDGITAMKGVTYVRNYRETGSRVIR
jgi:hypothetical protein